MLIFYITFKGYRCNVMFGTIFNNLKSCVEKKCHVISSIICFMMFYLRLKVYMDPFYYL